MPRASLIRIYRLIPLLLLALAVSAGQARAADSTPEGLSAIEKRIDSAINLMRDKKLDEGKKEIEQCAADLKTLLAKKDDNARAHYLLARALFQLGKDAESITQIDRAIALTPADAAYHHERGQILAQTNDNNGALASLAKATELAPTQVEYWLSLAYRYADLSAPDEAEKTFKKAIAANPTEPRLLGALGGVYANLSKPEEALAALEKAVSIDPKYANGWRNIGQIHQSAGRFDQSVKAYDALVKVLPEDVPALSKLVQNHTALNQPKERDAAREKIIALYNAGKIKQPFFCREQFKECNMPVMVFEYFTLTGERAIRYSFRILDDSGRNTVRTISLGSYEITTQIARETGEIGKNDRLYHLDMYEEGGHTTFGMYKAEPTYDQVRASVVAILNGKMEAMAESKEMKEKEKE